MPSSGYTMEAYPNSSSPLEYMLRSMPLLWRELHRAPGQQQANGPPTSAIKTVSGQDHDEHFRLVQSHRHQHTEFFVRSRMAISMVLMMPNNGASRMIPMMMNMYWLKDSTMSRNSGESSFQLSTSSAGKSCFHWSVTASTCWSSANRTAIS